MGFWDDRQWADYLGRYRQSLTAASPNLTINLIKASERLAKGDNVDYLAAYHGGALVADWLDQQLQADGHSLDQIWLPLQQLGHQLSSDDFYSVLDDIGGVGLAEQCRKIAEGRQAIP